MVNDDNATEFVLLRLEDDYIVEMLSVAFTISCKSLYEIIQLVSLLIVLNFVMIRDDRNVDANVCSVLA